MVTLSPKFGMCPQPFTGNAERICWLVNVTIGTMTCSALVTSKKVWDNSPTLMVSPFLVKTMASFPRRMDPDLKPFPYNPTGTRPFITDFSLKPKLKQGKHEKSGKIPGKPESSRDSSAGLVKLHNPTSFSLVSEVRDSCAIKS